MLWLLFGYVMTAAVAAEPARREAVLLPSRQPGENKGLQILQILASSSSLLAQALPTLGSVNSANNVSSKTIGIMNRISNIYI